MNMLPALVYGNYNDNNSHSHGRGTVLVLTTSPTGSTPNSGGGDTRQGEQGVQALLLPPTDPTPAQRNYKDAFLMALLVIVSFGAGVAFMWYRGVEKERAEIKAGAVGDGFLSVPEEITLEANEVGRSISVDTNGKKCVFRPSHESVAVPRKSDKECWLFASKPGTYSVQVTGAYHNEPLGPVDVKVTVKEKK